MEGQGLGVSSDGLSLSHADLHGPQTARTYPVYWPSTSDCPSRLTVISLEDADPAVLTSLAASATGDTFHTEARLVPTSTGHIAIMIGGVAVGSLPDPGILTRSQIARLYASERIPTCLLSIDTIGPPSATVSLRTDSFSVPVNNPPESDWSLLPTGTLRRAEPILNSPFSCLPDRAQVLMEFRIVNDVALLYLNGSECAILDADSLCWAHDIHEYFSKRLLVPVVRAYVTRNSTTGVISLLIDALAMGEWTIRQNSLPVKPLPALVGFRARPRDYPPLEFPSGAPAAPPTRLRERIIPGLQRNLPFLAIVLGAVSILFGLSSSNLNGHHAVGFGALGLVSTFLGGWVYMCRSRDTLSHRQPRLWSLIGPLALSTALPSLAFAMIGLFLDSSSSMHQTDLTQVRTLPKNPGQMEPSESPAFTGDLYRTDLPQQIALMPQHPAAQDGSEDGSFTTESTAPQSTPEANAGTAGENRSTSPRNSPQHPESQRRTEGRTRTRDNDDNGPIWAERPSGPTTAPPGSGTFAPAPPPTAGSLPAPSDAGPRVTTTRPRPPFTDPPVALPPKADPPPTLDMAGQDEPTAPPQPPTTTVIHTPPNGDVRDEPVEPSEAPPQ
ncbi:hypothetical protein [Corynebacterium pacaense]|uniref:hypothetical protein n=1 Tax=Corynebacterium pacaense TaxID=1816684 RepID=UPI0009BA61C2|nr:hypothetical protein [Corynebacterium pacaense]